MTQSNPYRLPRVLPVGAFLIAALAAGPALASIELLEPPRLVVDPANNTGSTLVSLRNSSTESVPILLKIGQFRSSNTDQEIGAVVVFSTPEGTGAASVYQPQDSLAEGGTRVVKATVSNLWEAGEMVAPIYNGQEKIGDLRATKNQLPFNVYLDPPAAGVAELSLLRGDKKLLTLKNDDAMTYPIRWSLRIGDAEVTGAARLDPKQSTTLEISPQPEWFRNRAQRLLRDEVRDGLLTLRYAPKPETASDPNRPPKQIPVRASLAYWPETTKAMVGASLVLLVLILGAVASFLLNHWLPNNLRRLALKERLDRLAVKTRDLSSRIGSYLRVVLRVERRRLEEDLRSRYALSPDFADTAALAEQDIQRLDLRVDLLEKIDSLYDDLDSPAAVALPPTLVQRIESRLQESEDTLAKASLQETELQTIQSAIADVHALLRMTQIDPTFFEELKTRFDKLWPDFNTGGRVEKTVTFQRLRPRNFDRLITRCNDFAASPTAIDSEIYGWLDPSCAKLAVIREYVQLYEDASAAGENPPALAGNKREERLLELLRQDTRETLAEAKLLLQQMRDGIYSDDLCKEIQGGRVTIEMEPLSIIAFQPIRFRVRFQRPAYNRAAALYRVTCIWDFGHDGLVEQGWSTCHFFPTAERRGLTVRVTFQDASGADLMDAAGSQKVILEKTVTVRARTRVAGDRLKVELLRLAAVVGAALLGLMAGARQELLRADLFTGITAVFLLGFGADALKNALTKSR